MPIVEEQVTVQVEARRVWDFLADPANLPVWDAVVQRAEQLGDGALAAGTVWRGDARLLGHQFQWTNEFAEVEAPRRRCQHGRGALGCALTQTLEVTDDRHTVLTQRVEVAEGLGGLFGELSDPVVTRAYARLLRAGLENLRSLLEDDARGGALMAAPSTDVVLTPGFTARRPPRLQLLAAAHDGTDTGPRGVHLRWFGPRTLPRAAQCTVHRLDDTQWTELISPLRRSAPGPAPDLAAGSLRWLGRERAVQLHEDVLRVTPASGPADRAVLLRFANPVLVVEVELDLAPPATAPPLRAFHRSHPAAVVAATEQRVRIEGPGITEVLVPAGVAPVRGLSWVPEHTVVAALDDRPGAVTVVSPRDVDDAYALVETELAGGPIRNRFGELADIGAFRARYGPDRVQRLVASVAALRLDPAATVHRAAQHGLAPADQGVAAVVELACLDPNVARCAGAYLVDHAADPDRTWRHVAVATFEAGETKSVSGFVRSDGPTPLPSLDTITAKQLPGFRYVDAQPLARVGLHRTDAPTAPPGPGPVLLDVTRVQDDVSEDLTAERPHLIPAATEQLFEDPGRSLDVPLTYVCRPVDLFGRSGDEQRTDPIRLIDRSAPPPPTGLTLRIDQIGYPWTDLADLEGDLGGGQVTVTFCFGEAQWRLAPDAWRAQVRWTDRPGDGTADLDGWTELDAVELRAPLPGSVPVDTVHPLAPVALAVAEVRPIAADVPSAVLTPAAADPRDRAELAGDRPRVELLLRRALLAPGLFDGHRCRLGGVTATVAASTAGLAYADDTTPDKRMTARLILDGATPVPTAGTAKLDLLALEGLSTSALRVALRDGTLDDGPAAMAELVLEGPPPNLPAGGELAVDLRSRVVTTGAGTGAWEPLEADSTEGTVQALSARIVAEPVADGGRTRHLARLRPADLLRLLLAQRRTPGPRPVRHHAPYVVGPLPLGVGTDAPIRVDLADGARFARVRVTAFVEDRGKLRGPPASPVEGRVLRPPPPPLAPPFPRRVGEEAARGTATAPDARRRSRVELAWGRSDEPTARYDVSRALDSALVALDRSLWEQGGPLPHHRRHPATVTAVAEVPDGVRLGLAAPDLPDPTGAVVEARDGRTTVRSAEPDGAGWQVVCAAADVAGWQDGDPAVVHLLGVVTAAPVPTQATAATVLDHGLVRIDLDADPDTADPLVACAGGRLVVRHAAPDGGDPVDVAYGLRTVRVHGGSVYALARPTRAPDDLGALVPGPAEATPPPDHSAVLADDASLRRLARVRDADGRPALDAAFGVVTGVPLTAAQADVFDDVVPGPGRSRFLYRVRAVGDGHSGSAWSGPSVAFHQFPPTPAVLAEVRCAVAGEHAVLSWRRPDRAVDGVEVALVQPDGHRTPLPAVPVQAEPRYAAPPVVLFDPPVLLAGGDSVSVRLRAADGSLTDLPGRVLGRAATGEAPATASGLRYDGPPVLAGTVEVVVDRAVVRTQLATRPNRDAVVVAVTDLTTPTVEVAPFVRHEDTVLRARGVEVAVRA